MTRCKGTATMNLELLVPKRKINHEDGQVLELL